LGDLDPQYSTGSIRSRYNINDAGDLYFIQSNYANYCKNTAIEFAEDSRREAVGFKRKEVLDGITIHHDSGKVFKIVEKYFEIA
jgi:hypothetical protein